MGCFEDMVHEVGSSLDDEPMMKCESEEESGYEEEPDSRGHDVNKL